MAFITAQVNQAFSNTRPRISSHHISSHPRYKQKPTIHISDTLDSEFVHLSKNKLLFVDQMFIAYNFTQVHYSKVLISHSETENKHSGHESVRKKERKPYTSRTHKHND